MKIILFFQLFITSVFNLGNTSDIDFTFSPTSEKIESNQIGNLFWYQLKLNSEIGENTFVFKSKQCYVNYIQFYDEDLNKVPFKTLDYKTNSYEVEKTPSKFYFVSVIFEKHSSIFPIIQTKLNFQTDRVNTLFFDGAYFGFVLMILIVNVFFYFSLKDKVFLYYIGLLTCISVCLICFDGYLLHWIPKYQHLVNSTFDFLTTVAAAFFTYHFLNLSLTKNFKKHIIVMSIIGFFCALFLCLAHIFDDFKYEKIGDLFGLLNLIYCWSLGINLFKKLVYARFFVIGYSLVLLSTIFYLIPTDFGFNSFRLSTDHVRFGALFEMLILTYAITYRVKIMQINFEKLQEELSVYIQKMNTLVSNSNKKDVHFEIVEKYKLTERETEVYDLIVKEYQYKEIANHLKISANTVKFHVRNIYEKLDIKNRKEVSIRT